MTRPRVIETNEGIQDKMTVELFDEFAKNMRDKGWNNFDNILKAGIYQGKALEIGPGPGFVGLEWLSHAADATLTGCEISPAMIEVARKNAKNYGFEERTEYVEGSGMQLPFQDETFDAVFSNDSLHEWENPEKVFSEIYRVLKPGGLFCITDMRRDVNPVIKWLIYLMAKPKEIRPGFLTSLNAAYTVDEMKALLHHTVLKEYTVIKEFFGLCISGKKT